MLKEYGFIRVGAVVNKIELLNPQANTEEIIKAVDKAVSLGIEIVVFPELCITGYTAQDMFFNDDIYREVLFGLKRLKEYSENKDIVFIVGAPYKINNTLYNCAFSFWRGSIIGITPKTYIPNYSEYYEYRYFSSAQGLTKNETELFGEKIPVSNMLCYKCNNFDVVYAIDICEDLWMSNAPSNFTSLHGANVIFNLSCSNEIVGKLKYRRDLIRLQAQKTISAYVYASGGITESASDLCFSGHAMIAEPNGESVENKRFDFETNLIYKDIDIARINHDRLNNRSYTQMDLGISYKEAFFSLGKKENKLETKYSQTPFLSHDTEALEEILRIQTYALAKRVKHLGGCKMVIGISGGSDSTLAFLICLRVIQVLHMNRSSIIAVTMPGFGTSGRTYTNARRLITESGVEVREISIKEACVQHFKDIGQSDTVFDITYENAQARERTQVLFDIANKENGIVIGTGDLSELALGWATYNGDHMSNYAVNMSIPKTLVTTLIGKIRDTSEGVLKETLTDILDTPISPELLPLDEEGNIQNTENSVGPYILHDFFLYHFLRYGASVKKLYFLALNAFEDKYDGAEIKRVLSVFIKRFFSQQFKRNCIPDGVKVGSISLSPRGDLRMSSEAYSIAFMKELSEL